MTVIKRWLGLVLDVLFPTKRTQLDISQFLLPGSINNRYYIAHYDEPVIKQAIWQLKYHGDIQVAEALAKPLSEEMVELAEQLLWWHGCEPPFIIVPMPSSKERKSERGWNQIELLCNALASKLDHCLFTLNYEILKKIKHTLPQAGLRKHERMINLQNCFQVTDPAAIKGRTIIVIDDVTTTGSSLAEAARTLQAAGAATVATLAIAHARLLN